MADVEYTHHIGPHLKLVDMGDGTFAERVSMTGGAGEAHLGSVTGNSSHIDVTLVLDTIAYADGDLLSDRVVVTNAMRIAAATGVLQSIQLIDEDDQGIALNLIFLSADVSLGTINSAPTITDANGREILGYVTVSASDYIDIGGSKIATKTGVGLIMEPATGTRNLYVAAVIRGIGTYTASGIKLRLGFLQD